MTRVDLKCPWHGNLIRVNGKWLICPVCLSQLPEPTFVAALRLLAEQRKSEAERAA